MGVMRSLQIDYSRQRRQWHGPVPTTPAREAVRAARGRRRLRELEDTDEQTLGLSAGWSIRVRRKADESMEMADQLGGDAFVRDARYSEDRTPDDTVSRDGRVRICEGRGVCGWFSFEGGYPFADRLATARRAGMSRHDAWLSVRRWTQEQARYCRRLLNGDVWFYGVIVELRNATGRVVSSDACWGFSSDEDLDDNDSVAAMIATFREQHIETLRSLHRQHRDTAADAMASAKALADDLRALMPELRNLPLIGEHVCRALRATVTRLRKDRRAALRVAKEARIARAQLAEAIREALANTPTD